MSLTIFMSLLVLLIMISDNLVVLRLGKYRQAAKQIRG